MNSLPQWDGKPNMLTTSQLVTLKNDIAADGVLNAIPNTSDGGAAIAVLYNLPASPVYRVWRTDIPVKDVKLGVVWTEYIGRSAGEQNAFTFMLLNGTLNAADANIRQGIIDIFSGPSGSQTRTNLTNLAKRDATRLEKLFATGTGSEASPATMAVNVEGLLPVQDVLTARAT